ncbi:S-layer homology domain-containing protein [Pseudoflavonifractor phocaeensis]|uniref:S-layer homology domain-containing protein n=1 Tax=Pseudoflavonifractor phocaeensis TaxID=1870988 RepID=UPI00313B59EF
MKRLAVFLLAGALMLPSPALGAEASGFSDVEAGSWYEEGVKVCVEAGLMEGVGQGRFAPGDRLSQPECLTLALRLYDLCHGGDGALPHAPAEWSLGRFTLELEDGTVLNPYVSDPEAVSFQPRGILFYLDEEQRDWAQGLAGREAVLGYQGGRYSAALEFATWIEDAALFFPVEYGTDFYPVYDELTQQVWRVPSPEAWYRDAWYYLEENGLSEQYSSFSFEEGVAASRAQFAWALARTGAELGEVNHISDLPDTSDEQVLALYNAGVLTGTDEYGRFGGEAGLTRAEAAVMTARVLKPELRKEFSLTAPAAARGYTLTYLMDGTPDCGVDYPVCVLGGGDGGASGVLTLDGRLLEWPGAVPSFGLERDGEYCYFSAWKDENRRPWEMNTGLMDRTGAFPVPMGEYDSLHSTGDGRFVGTKVDDPWGEMDQIQWFLLAADGTVEAELPRVENGSDNSWWAFGEGVCPWKDAESGLWGYVDARGDWAVEPTWTYAGSFRDGYAVVELDGLQGAIDRDGALVVDYAYPKLIYAGNGQFFGEDWKSRASWLVRPGGEAREVCCEFSDARGQNGFVACTWGEADSWTGYYYCYLDRDLRPITPAEFTFASDIGPDGAGFVGMDGGIYRIQFE